MEWISVKDRNNVRNELPKDRVFICLWKGAICLCEFDEDVGNFYIGMMPACYLGFWKLDRDREPKITHWMKLNIPGDY